MNILFTILAIGQMFHSLHAGETVLSPYLQLNSISNKLGNNNNNMTECFAIYLPLLHDTASQWRTDYSKCLENAMTMRTQLAGNMTLWKTELRQAALSITSYISNCLSITNNNLNFFNCFGNFTTEQQRQIFNLSFNATSDAESLSQSFSNIEVTKYQCINDTERNYVMSTVLVYDALDYCLQYGLPETVNTTTTSSSATTIGV